MFTTENYARFRCLECGEYTTYEPGQNYKNLNLNCKCDKEIKVNTEEIFTPVGEELDYYNQTAITVVGTYENGDKAVTQAKDEKVYRMGKAVFDKNYVKANDFQFVEVTETTAEERKEVIVEVQALELDMFKDITEENKARIKKLYTVEQLRNFVKTNGMRNYSKANEDELINKLVKKANEG